MRRLLAGLRLSAGLLTALPVAAGPLDRGGARRAVLAAPVIGAALGGAAWLVGAAVYATGGGALLAAVGTVALLAAATRGLHLDGLADLADGLGSGLPADGALAVMRRSDVGPFGVVTLVLMLLTQVAALSAAWAGGFAAPATVLAVVTGRLALGWGCRAGVPAARPTGLGALVAGTLPRAAPVVSTVLAAAVGLAWGAAVQPAAAVAFALAPLVGTGCALLLLRHALARLGGITGDVLGALLETATAGALVTAVLVLAGHRG